MSPPAKPWLTLPHALMLIGINLLWGANLLTSKWGVAELSPILFAWLRLLVMFLICLPWLRWFPGQMRCLAMVALCTGAGGFGLLAVGLSLAKDVATVAVFTQLFVPFSTLLSMTMLGEIVPWRRQSGIALAFVGVFVISFDPRAFSYVSGLLLLTLQSLAAALGMIYIKRLRGVSPLQLQAWIATLAMPVLLGLSLALEQDQVRAIRAASGVALGAVLFSVLGSSLVGQTGFFYLLKRYPVSRVAPLTVLQTLFGMALGVWVNHDQLTPRMWLGAGLTLLGVVIIEWRTAEAVPAAPPVQK